MKKLLSIVLLSLVIASSCSKEKSNDDVCGINMKSFVGSYRVTKAVYKANPSAQESDFYNALFPEICDQDDIMILRENGTYLLQDAGTKCSPLNDFEGDWAINGNLLTTDGETAQIDKFECNSHFVVSLSAIYTPNDKLTLTYTRQ